MLQPYAAASYNYRKEQAGLCRRPVCTTAGAEKPVSLPAVARIEFVMGVPTDPPPAMLLVAAFSRYQAALDWARQRVEQSWGNVALQSPLFDFTETAYYESEMGSGLRKQFLLVEGDFDPAQLVEKKLTANAWEAEYAATAGHAEPRPLNLDPGYITLGKLVLASTKEFAHRVYLGRGIYAEVTLFYKHNCWQHHAFTFADYRRADYHQFFSRCRQLLKQRIQSRA